MLGFRIFDRAAGMVSILILARLLQPEHFGIVVLASTVVAFVELLAALGLDTILIQKHELTRAHYDTAWTIQLGIAAICAVILAFSATPAVEFFREQRLEGIIYVLAVSILIEGCKNIRMVDFRREMQFDKEFLFLATRRAIAVIVTLIAAFTLRDQWALAIGILSSKVVGVALSYILRPFRPRLSLLYRDEFFGKSSWFLASNLVMFARNRAADLVVGQTAGVAAVGMYTLASNLAAMVGSELISPINRVALPDFSQQGTKQAVAQRFDVLTGQVAIFLAPLGVGLAACADLLIPVLFGNAWLGAVDVLKFLSLAALIAGLASNIGIAFLSLGHFRADAVIHAIGATTLLPLLAVGAYFAGATGAAAAVLIANTVTVFAALVFSVRAFDYGPMRFCLRIWRPMVAAGVMYFVIARAGAADAGWLTGAPELVHLAAEIGVGAVAYPMILYLLWALCRFPDGPERLTLRVIGQLLNRLGRQSQLQT